MGNQKPLIKQTFWHMATCLLIQVWLGCYHYFVRSHHLDWQDKKPTFSVESLDFTNSQIFPLRAPPFFRLLERQNARTVIINDDNPVSRIARSRGKSRSSTHNQVGDRHTLEGEIRHASGRQKVLSFSLADANLSFTCHDCILQVFASK